MRFDNFWGLAARNPEHVAVVDPGERKIAAGELLASVNQLSHGFQALGLRRGDSIAAILPNSREAIEVYLAMQQCGLYLTPINYHLVGPEIAYILQDCEAQLFIVHERYADVCRNALHETGFPAERVYNVGPIDGGFKPYDALKHGQPVTAPHDRAVGVVMNYTSGTTGRPKGVRRPLPQSPIDETDLGAPLKGYNVTPQEQDNVHLLACPWYHTAPLIMAGPSMHMGHTLVVMDGFEPLRALELIERYRVTITHLVPTQFVRLLALPENERRRFDTSSLRHVIHGAAPCSPDVKRRMIDWWGPVLDEYYNSTEGVGGTIIFSDEWLRKPGSVGKPRENKIVIMDEQGNVLGPHHVGTVYSMSPGREPFEYFKDPEKTEKSKRGDYRTVGDVGYMDEDGYLFLTDRKADMIISGGVNIYPAEIENALVAHPRVADVAVFGIPNPEWGEEVKAVVELLPQGGAADEDRIRGELLEFLQARIARYKLPRTIDFVSALPRDPNGKLYKRRLRDPYWAGERRLI